MRRYRCVVEAISRRSSRPAASPAADGADVPARAEQRIGRCRGDGDRLQPQGEEPLYRRRRRRARRPHSPASRAGHRRGQRPGAQRRRARCRRAGRLEARTGSATCACAAAGLCPRRRRRRAGPRSCAARCGLCRGAGRAPVPRRSAISPVRPQLEREREQVERALGAHRHLAADMRRQPQVRPAWPDQGAASTSRRAAFASRARAQALRAAPCPGGTRLPSAASRVARPLRRRAAPSASRRQTTACRRCRGGSGRRRPDASPGRPDGGLRSAIALPATRAGRSRHRRTARRQSRRPQLRDATCCSRRAAAAAIPGGPRVGAVAARALRHRARGSGAPCRDPSTRAGLRRPNGPLPDGRAGRTRRARRCSGSAARAARRAGRGWSPRARHGVVGRDVSNARGCDRATCGNRLRVPVAARMSGTPAGCRPRRPSGRSSATGRRP